MNNTIINLENTVLTSILLRSPKLKCSSQKVVWTRAVDFFEPVNEKQW